MRSLALLAALAAAGTLRAQSLAARVSQTDGQVQVVFPSRPDACGDGRGMLSVHSTQRGDDDWRSRCVHGPARVVATVMGGEVTRLRTYVGPVPPSGVSTINASAVDARTWLTQLVSSPDRVSARVQQDAMLPLVIADAGDPSALLLSLARDDRRPTGVRRAALTHLSNEVSEHLGIADARAETDDDELRRQAVFVLSQQGHGQNTPELMDLARSAKHPAARRDAIFWLGQSGDIQKVADLYAELLK